MRHLTLAELARLVDEAPSVQEADHLAACTTCRGDLEALRQQTEELARLPAPVVPAQFNLRVRDAVLFQAASARRRRIPLPVVRAAAGILLFVAGAGFGARVLTPSASPAPAPVQATALSGQASIPYEAAGPSVPAGTLAEAAADVSRTEAAYLHALTRYAELSENGEGLDPVSRLAALEGIVLTTRAALREAPADPVINNYHLTAISQRDALLRQIQQLSADDTWY